MLIEEMSPKIYKWLKRNNNNNKHSFTKAGAGGAYGVSAGGAEFEVTPLMIRQFC